ncbi:sec-independent protein translocase protein TatC [Thermosporothrix hazakensis]|jgi:sec-independent protein translocase protein TatC|uniref:Sec-independent protein translocase protein TatC n=2 Tax=Thermosporothrix TaxID=768650 RepID=A0A326UDB8_THEHA|nr:twin-arginine translocase subunit TatC [Thermosporothrix hazakensis]PZW36592.1 sec-independent protein translocase protein TatC [Thermosporothrix hazakensis]BBH89060.1 Sec-independent protein translocase protein TatC [Thermosporothrix sp. COM3]GCE47243.1 Sec-independent protein translocase protein TatC [Thermosporothrix hazakensis]
MASSELERQDRFKQALAEDDDDFRFDFGDDDDEDDELAGSSMTLVEHLEELRQRIFKCLIAIAVFSVVAFIFRDYIMAFLTAPLPDGTNVLTGVKGTGHSKLVVTGIAEGFTVTLMVSIAIGFLASLPVVLYQTWAFIAPGLYSHEKKAALPFVFIGIVLFVIGISIGYFILRYPLEFLIRFAQNNFTELVTAQSYFSFAAWFLIVFGLIFELPLVLTFMAKIGLVTSETLRKKRPFAHFILWLISCFLPGGDIYSPIIIGIFMSGLYELSIFFVRFFTERQSKKSLS